MIRVLLLLALAVYVYVRYGRAEDYAIAFVPAFLVLLFGGIALYPITAATGGALSDYSAGTREGYITKLSVRGLIYKTNEGEMQVGVGAMASLQEPWSFSVPDPLALEQVRECLGKHAVVTYKQWFIQPFSRGGSSYEVVAVKCEQEAE